MTTFPLKYEFSCFSQTILSFDGGGPLRSSFSKLQNVQYAVYYENLAYPYSQPTYSFKIFWEGWKLFNPFYIRNQKNMAVVKDCVTETAIISPKRETLIRSFLCWLRSSKDRCFYYDADSLVQSEHYDVHIINSMKLLFPLITIRSWPICVLVVTFPWSHRYTTEGYFHDKLEGALNHSRLQARMRWIIFPQQQRSSWARLA